MPILGSIGGMSARGFGLGANTPQTISLHNIGNTTGSGTSSSLPVGSTIPAGSLIIVPVVEQSSVVGAVSDSAGNSYSVAVSKSNTLGSIVTTIFYCYNCNSISSGGNITYSWGNPTYGGFLSAGFATGALRTSSVLDATGSSNGHGGAVSVTSSTPTQTQELFIGVAGQSSAPTQSSGWNTTIAGSAYIIIGDLISTNLLAETYSPTMGSSIYWAAVIASFKHG